MDDEDMRMGAIEDDRDHRVIEFVIFCIENLASEKSKDPKDVYIALKKSGLIHQYLIPSYDILHTQGKEYILEDIEIRMKEYGVTV